MSKNKSCLLVVLIVLLLWAGPSAVFAEVANGSVTASKKCLLIITPGSFRKALGDYIRHKEQQLSVRTEDLETVLKGGEGSDDPERLKRYLYSLWKKGEIQYVLLVGDADVFPVRYMVLDRVTPAAFDYAFYPSDLYYADLARGDGSFDDWNVQKESFHAGYYGEVRGEKNKKGPINFDDIDYIPEIAVGRWPVSTTEEVKVVSEKTIRYEEGILKGQMSGAHRIALVSVAGWVDSRDTMDKMASQLSGQWTVEKRYYSDKKKQYDTPQPTANEVVSLMNEGVAVICHAGHGKDLLWDQSLGLANLKDIHNADRLAIIFSAGCHTARFATLPPYEPYIDIYGGEHKGTDHGEVFKEPPPAPKPYQEGRNNPPSMGEGLLRLGGDGAVAYIGCNTGSQPCALTLMEGFLSGLEMARLGDCWNHAITHYHTKERLADLKPTSSWYPPSIFFQGMKFMLFGDPSLILPAD